jgi:hypothetical protein
MASTHDIAARIEHYPSESRDLAPVSGFLIGMDAAALEQHGRKVFPHSTALRGGACQLLTESLPSEDVHIEEPDIGHPRHANPAARPGTIAEVYICSQVIGYSRVICS